MLIAAEYPFLGVFLTMILFCIWVIYLWIAVTVLADVFRRRDIAGWAKAAWTVAVIVLPFLGVLVYLVRQHDEMSERTIKRTEARLEAFDRYAREAAGGSATEVANAKELLPDAAASSDRTARSRRTKSPPDMST